MLDHEKIPTWPPMKKAMWKVLMDEKLNDGHYIRAFDLIEKLYAALQPEGKAEAVAVPPKMRLSKEAIANLVFQCGGIEDGDPDNRWQDGVMWVGVLSDDDGTSVHGLHVYSTEYPEDGSVTLAEFQPTAVPGAITAEMVNAAWNKSKELRMTGLPSEFRQVLEAALLPVGQTRGDGLPQPRRKDGKEPCGECRLQPGETCDICGAASPQGKE